MGKPIPTFTIDEIEAWLAELPNRDPKLEGFTSTELREAIERETEAVHSQKWAMHHYIRPLVRAGVIAPKMIARKPLCGLHWTHLLGYVVVEQEEAS